MTSWTPSCQILREACLLSFQTLKISSWFKKKEKGTKLKVEWYVQSIWDQERPRESLREITGMIGIKAAQLGIYLIFLFKSSVGVRFLCKLGSISHASSYTCQKYARRKWQKDKWQTVPAAVTFSSSLSFFVCRSLAGNQGNHPLCHSKQQKNCLLFAKLIPIR